MWRRNCLLCRNTMTTTYNRMLFHNPTSKLHRFVFIVSRILVQNRKQVNRLPLTAPIHAPSSPSLPHAKLLTSPLSAVHAMYGCFFTVGFTLAAAAAPGAASVSLCLTGLSGVREAVLDVSAPRLAVGAGEELVDDTAEAGYGREEVRSYKRSWESSPAGRVRSGLGSSVHRLTTRGYPSTSSVTRSALTPPPYSTQPLLMPHQLGHGHPRIPHIENRRGRIAKPENSEIVLLFLGKRDARERLVGRAGGCGGVRCLVTCLTCHRHGGTSGLSGGRLV